MPSKIDIINGAYSQLRISGLTAQPTPEDIIVALRRLENMMSEFEGARNVCLQYNFEQIPDVNTQTGVAQTHNHMMETNLAVRLIPDFNKAVPPELKEQARQSFSASAGISAAILAREVAYPYRMPRGSGNTIKGNRWQRFYRPEPLPPNACSTNILTTGEIQDYQESFRAYLDGETIASYTIDTSNALRITLDSNDDEVVFYRVEALSNATSGGSQLVVITITTSTGRKEVRNIAFIVGSNLLQG